MSYIAMMTSMFVSPAWTLDKILRGVSLRVYCSLVMVGSKMSSYRAELEVVAVSILVDSCVLRSWSFLEED